MTILIWLAVGGAVVLIVSAIENVNIVDTIKALVQGKALPAAQPGYGPSDIIQAINDKIGIHPPSVPGVGPGNIFPFTSFTVPAGSNLLSGPGTYATSIPVTFSEWGAGINGFIATCVETAGSILQSLRTGSQVTAQGIRNAATTLAASGQADVRGATTFAAESQLLAGQGFATSVQHVGGYTANQLASTITQYVQGGVPLGIGWGNATVLRDTLSGQRYDLGVQGHAGVVEGVDSSGAFIADPNTPQGTPLVHYTWQNLADAQTNDLLVPQTSGVLQ